MKPAQTIVEHESVPTQIPHTSSNSSWKVKVFTLDVSGNWIGKGIGQCQLLHKEDGYYFHVKDDERGDLLLDSKIENSKKYSKDSDNIISWTDDKEDKCMALSFKNVEGAKEAQHWIDMLLDREEEKAEEAEHLLDRPQFATLPNISEKIANSSFNIAKRAKIAQQLLKDNGEYLKELVEVFREAERKELRRVLELIIRIWKGIIGLNEQQIIETLLGEELYMDTFGIFEYDKENLTELSEKYNFREFLSKSIKFNNTVHIQNPNILRRIHLNYHLLFFKDSVAARWLEEGTTMTISNIVNENYQEVLNHIFTLKSAPEEIVSKMESTTSFDAKITAVKFLLEICNTSKFMLSEYKAEFFAALLEKGLLVCLTEFLKLPQEARSDLPSNSEALYYSSDLSPEFTSAHGVSRVELIQVWSAEILTQILQALPLKVKAMLLSEEDKKTGHRLMLDLLNILFTSNLDGPKFEIIEFYKNLLDPESIQLKNDIFDVFYEEHIYIITDFLSSIEKEPNNPSRTTSLYLGLELLTCCAKLHGYRMRYYVTHNNVLRHFEPLYTHPTKYVRVAAVKFFRALIGTKEEAMCRYIVTNDLIKPIIVLASKIRMDNMLKSVVLELFDFIQRENVKILITHLVEQYSEFVNKGPLAELSPIKGIKIRYEQYKYEYESMMNADVEEIREEPIAHRKKSAELMAEEEEKYLTSGIPEEEEEQVDKAALERIREEMRRRREAERNTSEDMIMERKRVFPEDFSEEKLGFDGEEESEEGAKKKKVDIEIVFPQKFGID